MEKARALFKKADTDGNGTLSFDEFRIVLFEVGLREDQILDCFRAADVKMNEALSFDDFFNWLETDSFASQLDVQLPEGFQIGDVVYYISVQSAYDVGGSPLFYGDRGTVLGCGFNNLEVRIKWTGHDKYEDMRIDEVAKELPALPGGFEPGEQVFVICGGLPGSFYGVPAPILGPSQQDPVEEGIMVCYGEEKSMSDVRLKWISKEPLPLPPCNGESVWQIGDECYYQGEEKFWDDGDRKTVGLRGVITRHGADGPDDDGQGYLDVKFDGNFDHVRCRIEDISKTI